MASSIFIEKTSRLLITNPQRPLLAEGSHSPLGEKPAFYSYPQVRTRLLDYIPILYNHISISSTSSYHVHGHHRLNGVDG